MNRFWYFLHWYMEDRVLWGYNRREAVKNAWRLSKPIEKPVQKTGQLENRSEKPVAEKTGQETGQELNWTQNPGGINGERQGSKEGHTGPTVQ